MIRIGVDFGGTKIEAAALDETGRFVARVRRPNPGQYEAALETVREVVEAAEREAGAQAPRIGMGIPGSISPKTGLIRNGNSTWINGKPFGQDLERVLGRPVRLRNDANCFIMSEAADGAAAGAEVAFGAILGTGCGGGVAINGREREGLNAIAGEWGHTPLPWPTDEEHDAHRCWCGRSNCLETWIAGSAFVEDFRRATGRRDMDGRAIVQAARAGDPGATAALDRYIDRLGRALAVICDIVDPDVIVLGGGMSNTDEIYERVPDAIGRHVFSDVFETPVRKATHGDSSGVRGAAWLWPLD